MRVLNSGFAASSATVDPFLRNRFNVASSFSTSATMMSPFSAVLHRRMMTVSPSWMPASIIEFAFDFEREVLAVGQNVGRHGDVVGVVLNGADRRTGGDTAHHRDGDGSCIDDVRRRRRQVRARRPGAFYDTRLKAALLRGRCDGGIRSLAPALNETLVFGQLDHLDGAGSVRQATDETPLHQRRDQPVNAGLGPEIKGILHFVERGRHTAFLHAPVDEE